MTLKIKTDVKELDETFEAIAEKMADYDDAVGDMKTLKVHVENMTEQLKRYRQAALYSADESYKGFWANEQQAKEFGELVLASIGRKALSEGVAADGGYLVPDELAARIIDKLGTYGTFRRDSIVVPLGSDRLTVPKVTSDLTVFCPGEGEEIDESDMGFGQVGLNPKKWCCLAKVSSELEEDAVVAVGEIVGTSIARSMAKKEDLCGFLGDGTSTYFNTVGIVGALRAVDETIANIKGLIVASGNAYSEITLNDLRKVVGILPEEADANAKWYMNKKFYFNVIYPLAEAAGVASIFEILSNQKGRFLLGYPVEFVSCMPYEEDDSQICCLLGDLKLGAYLGQRRQLTIARSTEVFFKNDQIGIRGTQRIAPCVYGVGNTQEAGPIVGLITAAA